MCGDTQCSDPANSQFWPDCLTVEEKTFKKKLMLFKNKQMSR